MHPIRIACLALVVALAACPSPPDPRPVPPEEGVTVRVVNTSGEYIAVAYTFARMTPSHLGGVARGAEGSFTFAFEPGPLEFAVELPTGVLTSNRFSPRRGDRLVLEVDARQARVRREEEPGSPGTPGSP